MEYRSFYISFVSIIIICNNFIFYATFKIISKLSEEVYWDENIIIHTFWIYTNKGKIVEFMVKYKYKVTRNREEQQIYVVLDNSSLVFFVKGTTPPKKTNIKTCFMFSKKSSQKCGNLLSPTIQFKMSVSACEE